MNSIDENDDEELVSKSQRKREADAVRDFAARLVTESPQRLKRLPLTDQILQAIRDCPPPSTRGSHKRHIQYIGKLIRKTGEFDNWHQLLDAPVARVNPHLGFCNQLIDAFTENADRLRQDYPGVSLQQARQLAKAAAPIPQNNEETDNPKLRAAKKKVEKARKSLLKLLEEHAANAG